MNDGGGEMESLAAKSTGEACVVCEKSKSLGIRVWNQFLCVECERKIVSTDTDDEQYHYYLKQLRKVSLPQVNSQQSS
jgi:hypothetical protein